MSKIIEFPTPKPEAPDSDCMTVVVKDGAPVKWYKYSVSFDTPDGKEFSFHIWATSFDDAEERIACIRSTAKLDGQVFAEVPV